MNAHIYLHLFTYLVLSTLSTGSFLHPSTPTILTAVSLPLETLVASLPKQTEVLRTVSFTRRRIQQGYSLYHHPLSSTAAAFTAPQIAGNFHLRQSILYQDRYLSRCDGMATRANMKNARETYQTIIPDEKINDHLLLILGTSIQHLESTNNEEHDIPKTIHQAIDILRHLQYQANTFSVGEAATNEANEAITSTDSGAEYSKNEGDSILHLAPLQLLTFTAISTVESLHQLVQRVNKSRKRSKKSSGHAWKALQSVMSSSFCEDLPESPGVSDISSSTSKEIPNTIALLAMGIALSTSSSDESTTKMIASAVIPGDQINVLKRGKKYQKQEGCKMITSDGDDSEGAANTKRITHQMARSALLGCLSLAADTAKQPVRVNQRDRTKGKRSIDLQIVAKIESGFGVGEFGRILNGEKEDIELTKAIADIADCVFGQKIRSDEDQDGYEDGSDVELISKSDVAPTLSLVANIRPWNYVQVEKLVAIAAGMHLFCSAEVVCDSAIDTVVSSKSFAKKGKKVMMATLFPHGEATESLLADNLVTSSVPTNSIAHLAAGALIDVAFESRLYRLADVFASKYYHYGGPERYAEARFLHACDTITRVVKKKQVQVIDNQVARVDKMVARVSEDLKLASSETKRKGYRQQFHGDDVAIETMSEHIRMFSFRRLRASNMHAAAARLAKLWRMEYNHDPMQIMQELKERRLTYLQWDDEGCPGNRSGTSGALPLPELITEPSDLLNQFCVLGNNAGGTVGFDCEWHDAISGVALLQLSTITDSLLLDIPALTKTEEGCNALRSTVGKLFSHAARVQHVIGFSCKDDIKRLRVSPCVTAVHWFPQNERILCIKDLRHLIAETSQQVGGAGGMQHFGLSRACEAFLGKQLDKAEQCSDWLARPLSPEQREYACLDAWCCAAIHSKISEGGKAEENSSV
mmetsp:Transcript_8995/g.21910  ORF Transcript_8995/g.21910 Transcript_8995/m.21910 type:complete len:926 (+) Transcript_8995:163-2940(+)